MDLRAHSDDVDGAAARTAAEGERRRRVQRAVGRRFAPEASHVAGRRITEDEVVHAYADGTRRAMATLDMSRAADRAAAARIMSLESLLGWPYESDPEKMEALAASLKAIVNEEIAREVGREAEREREESERDGLDREQRTTALNPYAGGEEERDDLAFGLRATLGAGLGSGSRSRETEDGRTR